MKKALIMLVAALVVPLSGCGGDDTADRRAAVKEPPVDSNEAAVGKTVRLTASGPLPKLLVTGAGETITFRNETSGEVRLELVDGTKPPKPIAAGATFSHRFATAGMFAYWLGGEGKKGEPAGVVEVNPQATPGL